MKIQETTLEEEIKQIVTKCDNACDGNTCSMCGLNFSVYIFDSYDVKEMNVKDTSNEYYFVRENDDVSNNNKLCKFLLCWWFATNVHLITDGSNRIEMPAFLVKIIISACPEKKRQMRVLQEKIIILDFA